MIRGENTPHHWRASAAQLLDDAPGPGEWEVTVRFVMPLGADGDATARAAAVAEIVGAQMRGFRPTVVEVRQKIAE
jgi:hypothetical protein